MDEGMIPRDFTRAMHVEITTQSVHNSWTVTVQYQLVSSCLCHLVIMLKYGFHIHYAKGPTTTTCHHRLTSSCPITRSFETALPRPSSPEAPPDPAPTMADVERRSRPAKLQSPTPRTPMSFSRQTQAMRRSWSTS